MLIQPVLLSGGSGSRLWPLSRELYPKQLLALASEQSLIQDTLKRVSDPNLYLPPIIICNEEHRFVIAEQARAIGITPSCIILEPVGRNTAPAVALAAIAVANTNNPDTLLLVLPADHVIKDNDAFHADVKRAASAACQNYLVTFGIKPDYAETGYGYIKPAQNLSDGVYGIQCFIEKPTKEKAEEYLVDGSYRWNSGMFLFSAATYLEELKRFAADIATIAEKSWKSAQKDMEFVRINRDSFQAASNISIDYAVMEKTDHSAVVDASFGWTDIGSWSALWDLHSKDTNGNVVVGDVLLEDTKNSYIRSGNQLIALVGVENLVVVATNDAVLVTTREKAQEVKKLVEQLKKQKRSEATSHKRVYRPWGFYEGLEHGDRFQVKRIMVKPGAKLSLQKHHHRAEHWIVVNGTAIVTRDNEELMLKENESIYIPLGAVHRLENPGKIPLNLIEVQSGGYLGEDDIVRIEDNYGRVA
ncbi:MAG: mannose-1-phosphate guanylyltransferase/mannose-6-phosphate isomerase [Alphaproteobacteria bacterium]